MILTPSQDALRTDTELTRRVARKRDNRRSRPSALSHTTLRKAGLSVATTTPISGVMLARTPRQKKPTLQVRKVAARAQVSPEQRALPAKMQLELEVRFLVAKSPKNEMSAQSVEEFSDAKREAISFEMQRTDLRLSIEIALRKE